MIDTEKGVEKNQEGGEEVIFNDELIAKYTDRIREVQPGKIITGKIISVGPKDVIVDVGYKSEGIVSAAEFRDVKSYNIGDEIEVLVEQIENKQGEIILSKEKADKLQNWSRMVKAERDGSSVKGKVFKKVKGGFMVDVGMEAFLPASQVGLKPVSDLKEIINKDFEYLVVKVDEARKNIVLSRRKFLEEQRRSLKDALLTNLKIGDIVKGVVRNITDFGAFVDLNGLDGLLHITDMTWGRISHPSELAAIGDEIDIIILSIDKEKEKVSLGMKQMTPDPWQDIETKYPVGSRVKGRVVNIVPYGAFIELEKGIEGLIHVSELSWTKRISNPSEMLAVGDAVEVMVLSVDKNSRRISMGIKQIEPNPWTKVAEKYSVGSVVNGKVRNLTNYGVFVELEDGIDGLIHISDLSWTRKIEHPSEIVKKGDIVEIKVLSVDAGNQRIALGIKQLQPDPWEGIEDRYSVGSIVSGKVTKIAPFGVFVEVENGVEGLIHISQLPDKKEQIEVEGEAEVAVEGKAGGEAPATTDINEGDTVAAKVVSVSLSDRKIALSMKE